MDFTKQHNIFDRTNSLTDKLSKDTLTQIDIKDINDFDELITKSMLVSKRKIKKTQLIPMVSNTRSSYTRSKRVEDHYI